MARDIRITVLLSEQELQKIEEIAKKLGISKSAVIRMCINKCNP